MKASLVTSKAFLRDVIFSNKSRDNVARRFILLRELLASKGISLATYDLHPIENSRVSIHFDIHPECGISKLSQRGNSAILVVSESPIINKCNHDPQLRSYFKKILTWESGKVNKNDTFWIGCGSGVFESEFSIREILLQKNSSACMIFANKLSNEPQELYSARREIIDWYEENAPEFLNLYGMGWERRIFQNIFRPFNRIGFFTRFKHVPPKIYRGQIESKISILKIHKFCFCYENVFGHASYISEKIFDSMMVGCVPVYLGAPDVGDFIPKKCFIDRTDFRDTASLHRYLTCMSSLEYRDYLNAIKDYRQQYFESSFFDRKWAEVIVKHTLDII
jgi:alpha(1,3/1,4) fucosyltransferase